MLDESEKERVDYIEGTGKEREWNGQIEVVGWGEEWGMELERKLQREVVEGVKLPRHVGRGFVQLQLKSTNHSPTPAEFTDLPLSHGIHYSDNRVRAVSVFCSPPGTKVSGALNWNPTG